MLLGRGGRTVTFLRWVVLSRGFVVFGSWNYGHFFAKKWWFMPDCTPFRRKSIFSCRIGRTRLYVIDFLKVVRSRLSLSYHLANSVFSISPIFLMEIWSFSHFITRAKTFFSLSNNWCVFRSLLRRLNHYILQAWKLRLRLYIDSSF